jgi:RIO-like serine/threonine protein kinase
MDVQDFHFERGTILNGKYEVRSLLGSGWEGKVYKLKERATGIERAGKFFFPRRNRYNRTLKLYAKKLHRLRDCRALIQYYTQESMEFEGRRIDYLVSEYVEGDMLSAFVKHHPGKRLHEYQALHLLYALAQGVEEIHRLRQFHGDLHSDNIIVRRYGLRFEVKMFDFFHWKLPTQELIQEDVYDLIRLYHEVLGGAPRYKRLSRTAKSLCMGLKKSLIRKKFRNAAHLRKHLETIELE